MSVLQEGADSGKEDLAVVVSSMTELYCRLSAGESGSVAPTSRSFALNFEATPSAGCSVSVYFARFGLPRDVNRR